MSEHPSEGDPPSSGSTALGRNCVVTVTFILALGADQPGFLGLLPLPLWPGTCIHQDLPVTCVCVVGLARDSQWLGSRDGHWLVRTSTGNIAT